MKPRDDAAQLRLIADNLPAMSIAYDENLRCVFANRRFAEFFGLTTDSIVGKHLREIVGADPYREIKPYFDEVLAGHRATYRRTRVLDSGELRHLEVDLIPHFAQDGGVRGLFGVTTDVTERKREEQLRMLGHSVAQLIANADSSIAAVQAVIRAICETERWDCGRYFRPSSDGTVLRLAGAWGIEDAAIQEFLERSKDLEYLPGGGLIGEVWRSGQALWVADVSKEPRALRKAYTSDLVSGGTFQFPVKSEGAVIGVLIFNDRKTRTPDAQLLQVILDVGSQIGQFLQRKRAEERVRESEERLRAANEQLQMLIHSSPLAVYTRDANGLVTSWNPAAEKMYGWKAAEVLGKPLPSVPDEQRAESDELRARLLAGEPFIKHEARRRRSDGRPLDIDAFLGPLHDAAGNIHGIIAVVADITERKQAEERIQHLAHHDSLTDLPNRLLFIDRLGQAISLARRDARQFALFYLDLDQFKPVNDAFGHDAGDRLLVAVAAKIREQVRESDTVARVGGDEFAVILRDISGPRDAVTVAQKIIASLAMPFRPGSDSRTAAIGASIGIAVYPGDGQDHDSLIKKADTAMYSAKTRGNCFHCSGT